MFKLALIFVSVFCVHAIRFPRRVNEFIDNSFEDDEVKLWVLIAAGSNEYENYRHQADAYHAYQIMKSHGVPEEQIIIMHYDDIAYNSENPTPGIVINHPAGGDVYHGVPKDYTGNDLTPQNFLNILSGNAEAMKGIGSGKVIASGPNDHIFVNFVDHGADGIVAFPNDDLAATDLNNVIQAMFQDKKYAKMLLYFEACESGSMFDGLLPDDINVFATTASNDDESSYACYWDNERGAYLGDVYSVNWMEDCDKEDIAKESLLAQYTVVMHETNTSHVMMFGDVSMGTLDVGDFMGDASVDPVILPRVSKGDAVPQEQVRVNILNHKILNAQSAEERAYWIGQMDNLNAKRSFLMGTLRKIGQAVARSPAHLNSLLRTRKHLRNSARSCLDASNKHFSRNCFSLAKNEFALFNAPRFFANACMDGIASDLLVEAMDFHCTHQTIVGIH